MASLEASETMGSQWTAEQLAEEFHKTTAIVLVAEAEASFAGHAVARHIADEMEIMTLCVAPALRRRGWGRALLEGLLRSRAHQAAFLEIREGNQAGMGLYAASGFEIVGRREGYYRDGEDALIMRRNSLLG
jgi:ribosomal-protein-alanine N-acetyltransferase